MTTTTKLIELAGQDGRYVAAVGVPGLYEVLGRRVPDNELQAGDVIPFSAAAWVVRAIDQARQKILFIQVNADGSECQDEFDMKPGSGWFGVARMMSVVASVPVPDVRWNGTCPSCGRGTYTGLFSVEHEGGNCKG